MDEVKYSYALDSNDNLVNIKDAKKHQDITYYCLECHDKMIPKQGEHNRWHFAHKTLNCDKDTYLHSLAERKLKEWYDNNEEISFELKQKQWCNKLNGCYFSSNNCYKIGSIFKNFKSRYNKCALEKEIHNEYGTFRADLLLYKNDNINENILLEVCVTHPCSEEKLNSGNKIIEIKIESEEDIERIVKSNCVYLESNKMTYYNIDVQECVNDYLRDLKCIYRCRLSYGEHYMINDVESCDSWKWEDSIILGASEDVHVIFEKNIDGYTEYTMYQYLSSKLDEKFINHKNCCLCKYSVKQEFGKYKNKICCKLYKKTEIGRSKFDIDDVTNANNCKGYVYNEQLNKIFAKIDVELAYYKHQFYFYKPEDELY